MVRRKCVAVCISLMVTMTVISWSIVPAPADAAKWDLWDDAEELLSTEAQSASEASAGGESAAGHEMPAMPETGSVETVAEGLPRGETVGAADDSGYRIGPGDMIDIAVWKDEALSRSSVVLPDGTISFPLVGKVEVAGKTVSQVKDTMIRNLSRFVPELELTVDVRQSNSMMVYVIGRVNAPGRQVLNSNVTVLQALAMAGGLNPFANRNKIKIFRKEGEAKTVLTFRYNDVMDGNLESNIELKRGDVIVVP